MPDASLTCIDLWCRAGGAEQAAEHGMAYFLEHMVFKGSRRLEPGALIARSRPSAAAAMPPPDSMTCISMS